MTDWNALIWAAKDALSEGDLLAVDEMVGQARVLAHQEGAPDERAAVWFAAERLAMQACHQAGDLNGRQRAWEAMDEVSRSSWSGEFALPGIFRQWTLARRWRYTADQARIAAACMAVLRRGEKLAGELALTGNWDSAVDSQAAELLLDVAVYMMRTGLALGVNANFTARREAICNIATFPAMLDLAAVYGQVDRRCVVGLEEAVARRDLERALIEPDDPTDAEG